MRTPSGDLNRKCLNLHHGVNITDDFMNAVKCNKDYNLIDPHTKEVKGVLSARKIWQKILETRLRTGEPYLNFIDTINRALPKSQKDKGLYVRGSNLCNEIHQVTNEERTAVCCLSSINAEMYDEWKDTKIVEDLVTFLDNILDFFIKNAPKELSKAVYSATQERSIGLGILGLHSLFQKRNISFESYDAKKLNIELFKLVRERCDKQSLILGEERGEAPDMIGTGERFSHKMANAPNANSGLLCNGGVSAGIEPIPANVFTSKTRVGSHEKRNKYLKEELKKIGKDNEEVWSEITSSRGSVKNLPFLTNHIKDVYKTAFEIDNMKIVELASDRQNYICQGQSLNLFFPSRPTKKELHDPHYYAWESGCKGLYYARYIKESETSVSKKIKREALSDIVEGEVLGQEDDCLACDG
jgi:ribonucleoside-diphosphate reductase alpha chain